MDTGTIRRVRWVIAALALTTACAFLAWAILLAARAFSGAIPCGRSTFYEVGSTTLEETRPILARYRASTLPASVTGQYSGDTGFYIVGDEIIERLGERLYFLRYVGLSSLRKNADPESSGAKARWITRALYRS
jgi:hypothetical protein